MGGIMHSAEALTAWFNPTINSYKRINAPVTSSGATWSPNTITYSGNNRTHMIRVPGSGRFELRLMDGATNPYLLQAGIIAAGLDGLDKKSLQDLIASIKRRGIITPITVKDDNGKFTLIAGERRFRASKLAGLKAIPSYIVSISNESELMEIALMNVL